jgi:hypothetical protein
VTPGKGLRRGDVVRVRLDPVEGSEQGGERPGLIRRVRFLADIGVSITTVGALRDSDQDAVDLRDDGLIRLPDAAPAPALGVRSPFECENQTPAVVKSQLSRVIGNAR